MAKKLKPPTEEQLKAIHSILGLAENHQMWTSRMIGSPSFKKYADEQYAAINNVRDYLESNGVITFRAAMQFMQQHGLKGEKADG